MSPLLLVLDLDETLVYAAERPLSRDPDFETELYWVYRRPHLSEFLRWALNRYRVAVWTASSRAYAEEVVANIFPSDAELAFVWARERCTQRYDLEMREYYWIKNFRKLRRRGFDLDRVLVVDDTAKKHERNFGNLIEVQPYVGDPKDDELKLLRAYLATIAHHPNLRAIEKRGWRRKVEYLR